MMAIPEVSTDAVQQQLEAGTDACLLDVREPYEFAQGHIPGALLMPLSTVPQRAGELDPARDLIVICRSGGRSAAATEWLLGNGFKAVNMAGGMLAWRGPTER